MSEKVNIYSDHSSTVVPGLVYLAWTCAFIWLLVGGRYRAFLHPNLWPLLLLGSIISFLFLASLLVPKPTEESAHGRKGLLIRGAILGLPLLFLWIAQGKALGTYAFSKRSQGLVEDATLLARALDKEPAKKTFTEKKEVVITKRAPSSKAKPPEKPMFEPSSRIKNLNQLGLKPQRQAALSNKGSGPKPSPIPKNYKRTKSRTVAAPNSLSTILADRLPTPENPLPSEGTASAQSLSGSRVPKSFKLFSRLKYHSSRLQRFEGKRFGADGEVFSGNGVPEGFFLMFRWFINHCTADAAPLGIIVHSKEIKSGEESFWVHLEGTLKTRMIDDKRLAYIEAELVRRIATPPPEERYITY